MATIYLSLLGKQGIREVAQQNLAKAEYTKQKIAALQGFSLPFSGPTFNEFVIEAQEGADAVLGRLEAAGILGGISLGRWYGGMPGRFLICVTEQNTREEIDTLVVALAGGAR
jgi:glycine dehydrogenase subunit 1